MRRYLIVDDNVAFAENLAEIIADAGGAEAVVVDSGEKALARVQRERFDALVSDMRMPEMNGAELVHLIRRADPELPALVVTAYTADNELEAARREGLMAVLPKPVPVPRLLEHLGRARRNGIVALVEDDVALADNLTEALRGRGFAAVTAHSVVETERLGVRPFAAVVDLRLPGGVDGEAMRRLAAKFPGLPMVVATAHGGQALPVASAAVFEKPFDTSALLAAIERLHG
ncbi:MAG TPA: response regulator [Polyangia bacterium]|nr:response regulator [Polyangia bacterium]